MGRVELSLIAVVAMCVPVHAGVAVEGDVPFTARELVAALELRGAAADTVAVRMVSPTSVDVRTSIGNQRVDLGTARGPSAARLVALQVAPLGPEPATSTAPMVVDTRVATPIRDPGWRLGLTTGGGHGSAALDFALVALRADATRGRGAWRWGASLGWLHGLARTPDRTDPATADLGIARAAAGIANDEVELMLGPELVAYRVTAASPGVTAGAGGSIRLRLAGGSHWQAIASADVDGFLHRVVITRSGVPFAGTPRVAFTAALGVAWIGP